MTLTDDCRQFSVIKDNGDGTFAELACLCVGPGPTEPNGLQVSGFFPPGTILTHDPDNFSGLTRIDSDDIIAYRDGTRPTSSAGGGTVAVGAGAGQAGGVPPPVSPCPAGNWWVIGTDPTSCGLIIACDWMTPGVGLQIQVNGRWLQITDVYEFLLNGQGMNRYRITVDPCPFTNGLGVVAVGYTTYRQTPSAQQGGM